jgi:hypothetical protein
MTGLRENRRAETRDRIVTSYDIEDGDILVSAWTAPTYNAVLAAVSAVVVQEDRRPAPCGSWNADEPSPTRSDWAHRRFAAPGSGR